MFGYIQVNKPEMKIREFEDYQSFYCGLCHSLRNQAGIPGQLTLTYDMTFLAILLTALYEDKTQCRPGPCPVRPWRKVKKRTGTMTEYASCMNVLLACYNLEDDWLDDHKIRSRIHYCLLLGRVHKLEKKYPRQCRAVQQYLKELHQCESDRSANLDLAAGLTGEMLGEIFVYQEDIWADDLRKIGFFLGKFIYLMDAMEDMEEDEASDSYNPWLAAREEILRSTPKGKDPQEHFKEYILQVLTMMMAETTRAFERLPILEYEGILRNILYSGVWSRYEAALSPQPTKKGRCPLLPPEP